MSEQIKNAYTTYSYRYRETLVWCVGRRADALGVLELLQLSSRTEVTNCTSHYSCDVLVVSGRVSVSVSDDE